MSLWSRLKSGLSRSSDALGSSLSGLMGGKKLRPPETLGELEDALIMADLGVATAATITENLRARRDLAELDDAALRAALARKSARFCSRLRNPLPLPDGLPDGSPSVILLAGVNGAGKTTTIGKLARNFRPRAKASCWPPATRFAPPPPNNCKCGGRANVPV